MGFLFLFRTFQEFHSKRHHHNDTDTDVHIRDSGTVRWTPTPHTITLKLTFLERNKPIFYDLEILCSQTIWSSQELKLKSAKWKEGIPKEIEVTSNLSTTLDAIEPQTSKRKPPLEDKDIVLLDSLLSPEECQRIITATEEYGYGKTDFLKNYRGNTRLKCKDPDFAER